jgi:formate/nitrite transporter FocA (FNT family)
MKANLTFIEAIAWRILCNILVAIVVTISYEVNKVSDKIIASMLPVLLFVVNGYEHSIANFFILPWVKLADIYLFEIVLIIYYLLRLVILSVVV